MKKASFTIEFDGEDVSATWGKRLVSATVTDNEPGTLDTLVLVFSNAGKAFDPVFPETVISFSLGYAGEPLRDFIAVNAVDGSLVDLQVTPEMM